MNTVLVADDNSVSRELLRAALEPSGVRVIEASDGLETLRLIEQDCPDLVLLDIQMPAMDGFAVLREVRAQEGSRHLPVIAFTALAMESDRQRILAVGFDGYVTKPISISDVRRQVEQLLGGAEGGDGA
jgi:CheY-like chemotaxis protein